MALKKWATIVHRHQYKVSLLALVITFSGVTLLLDAPKGANLDWLGVALTVLGGLLITWGVWPRNEPPVVTARSLANRLIRWLTWDSALLPFFPLMGVAAILADLGYNTFLSATPAIQSEDAIVLLAGVALIGYNFVTAKFGRERDFVFLFFVCLNMILVVPLLAARAFYADFERSVDVYSWVALAPQASTVLSLLGVTNSVHMVPGSTAPGLTFTPQKLGVPVTVVITAACSGIYSFGIFASAFVGFVLTEVERLSKRIWVFLILGFLASYVANILRMVVIVLIGFYTDSAQTELQNMLIAHSYGGWIIFIGWVTAFWGVLFRFLPPGKQPVRLGEFGVETNSEKNSLCRACGGALTPAVPARRCVCGAILHLACFRGGFCPVCGHPQSTEAVPRQG